MIGSAGDRPHDCVVAESATDCIGGGLVNRSGDARTLRSSGEIEGRR